jgi:hypothetical protein
MSFAVLNTMNDQRDIAKIGFRSGGWMRNVMCANIDIQIVNRTSVGVNPKHAAILINMADVLAATHATK